jgi:hypothetical protein
VQRAAHPLDVGLMVAEEFPKAGIGQSPRNGAETQDFCHHQKHDQTAISIDGRETKGRPGPGNRIH